MATKDEEHIKWVDPSERAAHALEKVIKEGADEISEVTVLDESLKNEVEEQLERREEEAQVEPVETELSGPQLRTQGERKKIRVLMISSERNVFVDGSPAQARIARYGELFEELHLIVFTDRSYEFGGMQLAENVWAYPTNSKSRWFYGLDAIKIAKKQLLFSGSFRADVISAQDPFETGLVGYWLSKRFKRGLQLQLHTDPYEPYFKEQDELNKYRLWISRFLLPRADRVRVVSDRLREEIEKRYPEIKGRVDVLPIFTDLADWRDATPEFNLHERYPQFKFIILMASRLVPEKNIGFAIDACQFVLRQYETVGMVIVGDGPERESIEEKIKERGLEGKIILEPWQHDIRSHMKTADMFLLTSTYEGYGQTLVEAAASGLPVLTTLVGIAPTLFENEESGLVCPIGDMGCVIKGINAYLGNNALRQLCAKNAQERAFSFVASNVDSYQELFRESMERAVLSQVTKEAEAVENNSPQESEPVSST